MSQFNSVDPSLFIVPSSPPFSSHPPSPSWAWSQPGPAPGVDFEPSFPLGPGTFPPSHRVPSWKVSSTRRSPLLSPSAPSHHHCISVLLLGLIVRTISSDKERRLEISVHVSASLGLGPAGSVRPADGEHPAQGEGESEGEQ